MASPGHVPHSIVYYRFLQDWRCVTASELYHALRALEDATPIGQGLREALDDGILVKPQFAALPGTTGLREAACDGQSKSHARSGALLQPPAS